MAKIDLNLLWKNKTHMILMFCFLNCYIAHGQTAKKKERSEYYKIDSVLLYKLRQLAIADQKWRNYHTLYKKGELKHDTLSLKQIENNILATDSINYLLIKNIYEEYGFPTWDIAGQEGTHDFWLLIQHQDKHPDFQNEVLIEMKKAVDFNKASGTDYAYLLDRININMGKPQIYGTQMQINYDSTSFTPKPMVDPKHVNHRRRRLGMDPIEQYIKLMNQHFLIQHQ